MIFIHINWYAVWMKRKHKAKIPTKYGTNIEHVCTICGQSFENQLPFNGGKEREREREIAHTDLLVYPEKQTNITVNFQQLNKMTFDLFNRT